MSRHAAGPDLEDAAQEALIILYRKIGMLRATGALTSWMFRIVRNECLRRARTILRDHPPEPDAAALSAEDEAQQRLEAATVVEAIGFSALIGAFALMPAAGPLSLLLLPVALIAFRGCPTCWVVGLLETVSRGKLGRDCGDGRCAVAARN